MSNDLLKLQQKNKQLADALDIRHAQIRRLTTRVKILENEDNTKVVALFNACQGVPGVLLINAEILFKELDGSKDGLDQVSQMAKTLQNAMNALSGESSEVKPIGA